MDSGEIKERLGDKKQKVNDEPERKKLSKDLTVRIDWYEMEMRESG